ncbi:uncharacterized protein [Clytia hemisphaerica]|uniref:KxDL domain-containing protein n=1 Tax=Clytia hemisphaerica TaxID=252671 RepID=A0A7M5WJE1_9CNID
MEKKSFNQLLKDLEGCKDVTPIIKAQKSTLLRYEEINEMLRQFLELSNNTQSMLLENYIAHTKTLIELKKDLEISFRRIRALKTKLNVEYPDAFEATSAAIKELEEINRHFQEDDKDATITSTVDEDNSIDISEIDSQHPQNKEDMLLRTDKGYQDKDLVTTERNENITSINEETVSNDDNPQNDNDDDILQNDNNDDITNTTSSPETSDSKERFENDDCCKSGDINKEKQLLNAKPTETEVADATSVSTSCDESDIPGKGS